MAANRNKPSARSGVETGARILGVILYLTGPQEEGSVQLPQRGDPDDRRVTSGQLARLLYLDTSYIRRTCQNLVRSGILTAHEVHHPGVPPAVGYRVSRTFAKTPYPAPPQNPETTS